MRDPSLSTSWLPSEEWFELPLHNGGSYEEWQGGRMVKKDMT